ncbi:MAG: pantoate--beta-alanine ligase [Deltaproteobacteria bacterium]|nr:pantoate--beta-alanine ligase [Deltaproteobacteria bacterium]
MQIIKDINQMRGFSSGVRKEGLTIGFVPTMGALHNGHLALVQKAKDVSDKVVMSIFVNPAQFSAGEDYNSYPRDIEGDVKKAEVNAVDAVFIPSVDELYPQGFGTLVEVKGVSENLCGAARHGHFRGVATIVLKLFNIVMPDKAVFGLKDYQQYIVIKKMVHDLDLDIEVIGIRTVRDEDGLALSSRNSRLSADERMAANVIPSGLKWAEDTFLKGEKDARAIIEGIKKIMEKEPLVVIEYVKVCDVCTLKDIGQIDDKALVAIAARIGRARLIDNVVLKKRHGGNPLCKGHF